MARPYGKTPTVIVNLFVYLVITRAPLSWISTKIAGNESYDLLELSKPHVRNHTAGKTNLEVRNFGLTGKNQRL